MASLQLSGYQCEFVESVGDYECPLCLHVTREPSLTSCCGQHFCQACIQKILTDNKPCPFCKGDSFTVFLDKKHRRRVLDLKVYCDKKADGCDRVGCDWVGGLGELEQHLTEKCALVSVDCQYNCGKSFMRISLAFHEARVCPKRPHSCEYCLLEGTYQDIQDDHLPVCPKYPVACPNECGVAPSERGQLKGHLRECPLAMVECELKELGCEEVVQRENADKHMEQAAQKHMRLMASHYLNSQRTQDEAIAKLQEENKELKQSFDFFRQKYEKLELESKHLSSQVESHTRHVSISCNKVTIDYEKERKQHKRWKNSEYFCVPQGYVMEVNFFFNCHIQRLEFELTSKDCIGNDILKWPKTFTMTVTMLNQANNHSHYHITKELKVEYKRDKFNDHPQISYKTIDLPPFGVNYIVNGQVKFQIIVSEKY
ncbi:TNF receptor-associated factor 4-like [Halichondria panicea]|uniref:TNF receptor-associated factor 4-like n=1 Tax=Halichondria panicea TaxID=6063 RepID=UPI00312B2E4F